MLKIFLVIAIIVTFHSSASLQSIDSQEVESWKSKGQYFKENGQNDSAITYFRKILERDPNDYDATLNMAQLYLDAGEFNKSIAQYKKIIEKNENEPFAHFGLGMNYLAIEEYSLAKHHFKRTTQLLPEFIPGYSRLASVYVYTDENDLAIEIYKKIIILDNSNADAYAWLGKLYWWQGKPYTAKDYYEKAIRFNKDDKSLRTELKEIKKEIQFNTLVTFRYLNETELGFITDSYVQRYFISKRLSDWFVLKLSSQIDYAVRNDEDKGQGKGKDGNSRWFDNTGLRSEFIINPLNRIHLYLSGSINDTTLTAYGTTIQSGIDLESFKIRNYLTLGYDYFYYWNQVDQNFIQNSLLLNYDFVSLSLFYKYGVVKENYVEGYDRKDINPSNITNTELIFQVLKSPVIKVGLNYKTVDFKYSSPLYYSPQGRDLKGVSASYFDSFGDFYLYLGGAYRFDNNSVESWNYDFETGYEFDALTLSVGVSKFFDPYYRSLNAFLNVGISF